MKKVRAKRLMDTDNSRDIRNILSAIGRVEKLFDKEYLVYLKKLVDLKLVDRRLLTRAEDVSNDFASIRRWSKEQK